MFHGRLLVERTNRKVSRNIHPLHDETQKPGTPGALYTLLMRLGIVPSTAPFHQTAIISLNARTTAHVLHVVHPVWACMARQLLHVSEDCSSTSAACS